MTEARGLTDGPASREQRLAFGRVAELYERARPSYPPAALDEALAHARAHPGELVLEVGAGTGKATRMLAKRGLRVLAIEPDRAMARVARESLRGLGGIELLEIGFEDYAPREPAALVFAAQSWHWVDARVGFPLAAGSLRPGGALAAIWTVPRWEDVALRERLREVYAQRVPAMTTGFPMHPAGEPEDLAARWRTAIAESGCLERAHVGEHRFSLDYSPQHYAELLSTHQDHILLGASEREQLLEGIREAVASSDGGLLRMPYSTFVCLASPCGSAARAPRPRPAAR